MRIQMNKPVGQIAAEMPSSIPYFEERGIDYCCGGQKTLQEACAKAGVKVEEMIRTLEAAAGATDTESQWATLSALTQYLLEKHHAYTRSQLALVSKLGTKVLAVHGNPELAEIMRVFQEMDEELIHHLLKEEQVAFPFLVALEERTPIPFSYQIFQNAPQQVLMQDHEATGKQLGLLRQFTKGYTPPPDACVTFRAFYQGMKDLENDIHQHIHLENNVLFPMAEKLAAK